MPTYKYKCNECGKDYLEHRLVTDAISYTHCHNCGTEYVEVTE
jgi:putative FmdB family regulatory protein